MPSPAYISSLARAVVDADGVIERASYELCVIVSLKDAKDFKVSLAGAEQKRARLDERARQTAW
ncbi:hypothetical protein AB0B45_38265 [Nonomuraea sp. NPDC049152]|uniref:hypothetical protein n=1 Tax=Nonomuraea sp. NPDC049152 TaxID=3154350 RepID=UPI003409C076